MLSALAFATKMTIARTIKIGENAQIDWPAVHPFRTGKPHLTLFTLSFNIRSIEFAAPEVEIQEFSTPNPVRPTGVSMPNVFHGARASPTATPSPPST
jgi:hypothetical protein